MLDHVFITVEDFDRSIAFYKKALKPLGIAHASDFDGKDGPEGHPDLKAFGRDGRIFFWLRQGDADAKAAHIGFVANSEAEVNAFYKAAMAGGRDRQRQARRARVLRSPLLRCERFRSRRLQSGCGLQELATPPIIEPQN